MHFKRSPEYPVHKAIFHPASWHFSLIAAEVGGGC
jgi:hypothetical protein